MSARESLFRAEISTPSRRFRRRRFDVLPEEERDAIRVDAVPSQGVRSRGGLAPGVCTTRVTRRRSRGRDRGARESRGSPRSSSHGTPREPRRWTPRVAPCERFGPLSMVEGADQDGDSPRRRRWRARRRRRAGRGRAAVGAGERPGGTLGGVRHPGRSRGRVPSDADTQETSGR